ncbi:MULTISPECIES: GntR family transcriptional regulator [Paenibacillus]|uniref:Transcriptional regulator, GntR family n=1 Tax=Paenibacillus typhae TaxID=1174501 RepID=A0A1G8UIU5_9BACL|nr:MULTISPECIES: GntR family transcriptional regulator [Paenibacillus]KUP23221.1 GntR family transcriptional regulator [Paenibacillus sp. DMB5]MBY0011239.1 GntR family transcriptional regulator [Paenibacillus typhae]MDF9839078.1 GntR family transcriptional regulator [Paenibacillus sp. PastF-2]MDF9845660.1 GntR family transcriptional regulator [Paenibacillus sp. PastM-2]MDF9852232.1 GntR family transcriptional regulator [Paenibacillus sp. PastF-1]
MTIEFDNNQPIYLQIMNYLKGEIITGKLKPGDKIPSVRELAAELQINPNTVQRTFQELEREEIVETRRGMGRYVTGREETIMKIKREMAQDILERFVRGMQELGFQSEEIVKAVADNIAAKESRGM